MNATLFATEEGPIKPKDADEDDCLRLRYADLCHLLSAAEIGITICYKFLEIFLVRFISVLQKGQSDNKL